MQIADSGVFQKYSIGGEPQRVGKYERRRNRYQGALWCACSPGKTYSCNRYTRNGFGISLCLFPYTILHSIYPDYGRSPGKNLLATRDPYQNFGINNIRVDGEIEILKSDAVVLRAVEKAGLLDDVEFGINAEDANVGEVVDGDFLLKRVILSLQSAISVSRTEGTYLITAKVSSTDPKRAAYLTNILAEAILNIKSRQRSKV